jgi:hypothetical protein
MKKQESVITMEQVTHSFKVTTYLYRPVNSRSVRLPRGWDRQTSFLKPSKFIGAVKRVLTGDRVAAEMIWGTALNAWALATAELHFGDVIRRPT